MQLIEETYFGWDPLTHTADCPSPIWDEVQIRHDEGARPDASGTDPHACASSLCTHGTTFARVQLRLLCRDCDTVHLISGEGLSQACTTPEGTGWGQAPRRMGDVWLWPGPPVVPGGEAHQYLVTLQPAALTQATLFGIITRYRDADHAPRWIAAAVPDEAGAHQVSTRRWRHASRGLAALEDAAAWITAVDTTPQRPVVVSV
ncbi:hypothetical protein [Streptomyces nigra]|uniref:hypothetical protein n=1 Tax=Streptomyces nigra TaxID=1827580 RepID=UPI00362F6002